MVSLKKGLLAALSLLGTTFASSEALPATLLDLGDGVIGGLYRPSNPGTKAGIAVFVMHAEQDYLNFVACTELQQRGYTVLCANNNASKSGKMTDLAFEDMLLDAGKGISYLRNQTDINQVVILGHSGGGAMLTAYQNIAEKGVKACQGPEKIYPCSNSLVGFPPADGFISINSNYGLSTMTLLSVNPAITDENSDSKINASLNLYNPANGYTKNGANYTSSFKEAFQSGVVSRWNRILNHTQNRNKAITAGNGLYKDDEPLTIPDANYVGMNNKFFAEDIRFLAHTTHAWPLLHKNGTSTKQIVHSVRVPTAIGSFATSFYQGTIKTTVRRFLETLAIRVSDDFAYHADGFTGIDWSSSQTAPVSSVAGIGVPILAMGMTGHWEYLNAEEMYLNSGSNDTSIAFVEGASHTITPCTECEPYPGQYGDTVKTTFDHIDQWLGKKGRFL